MPKPSLPSQIIEESLAAPVKLASEVTQETVDLLKGDGAIPPRVGLISSILGLALSFLCVLGVAAFHFPEYLTTPELRKHYSVDLLRQVLFVALLFSGTVSAVNIVFNRRRKLNIVTLSLVLLAVAGGGSKVPVGDFPDHTPYIGLDWFILDLLGSTLIFVLIEKLFPLYRGQPVFRKEWQTDFVHFMVNHFIVGLVLLTVNFLVHKVFGWLVLGGLQQWVQHIPFVPQLLLCLLVADLAQYWTHRAYHEVPFLWKFHSVHHSTKTLDWLAGSRMHLLELIVTRVSVLGPLYVLGFDKGVMDLYIIIVGFQAVFNHANVHLPWGPLKYLVVTPDFHHWHHSSEKVAIDKNYAAHFAFLDYLFGTVARPSTAFPEKYGVVGQYMPDGFVLQQMYPFKRHKKGA